MKKTLLGLVLLLFYTFLIGEAIPQESLEKGWELFREDKFEQANGIFEALIEDKTLLAEAYLGSAWCMMMLYDPNDEVRLDTVLINLEDYDKQRFYIHKPHQVLELYNEEDSIHEGWIDNAIKLGEYRKFKYNKNRFNARCSADFEGIVVGCVDYGKYKKDYSKNRKSKVGYEIGQPNKLYDFEKFRVSNDNYITYNNSFKFKKEIKDDYTIALFSYYWLRYLGIQFAMDTNSKTEEIDTLKTIVIKHSDFSNEPNEDEQYIVKNIFMVPRNRTKKFRSVNAFKVREGKRIYTLDKSDVTYKNYFQLYDEYRIMRNTNNKGEFKVPMISPLKGLITEPRDSIYVEIVRYIQVKNISHTISNLFDKALKATRATNIKEEIYFSKLFFYYYTRSGYINFKQGINNDWKFKYNPSYNYTVLKAMKAILLYDLYKKNKDHSILKDCIKAINSLNISETIDLEDSNLSDIIENKIDIINKQYLSQIMKRRLYD